jgi:hypothetical protein
MAHRFDLDSANLDWEREARIERDSHREHSRRQAIPVCREDDLERLALTCSAAFVADIEDLDGPDGLDEDLWNRAMEQACEQDGAR